MNPLILINALGTGRALKAKAPWKLAGLVGLLAGVAIQMAQSHGWLGGLSESDLVTILDGLLYLFGLYTIPATTDTIGLFPAPRPLAGIDGMRDRVGVLPTSADAPPRSDRREHGGVDDALGGFGSE